MAVKNNEAAVESSEPRYRAKELIRSAKGFNKDILSRILDNTKTYTQTEADGLVEKYLSKEVKN